MVNIFTKSIIFSSVLFVFSPGYSLVPLKIFSLEKEISHTEEFKKLKNEYNNCAIELQKAHNQIDGLKKKSELEENIIKELKQINPNMDVTLQKMNHSWDEKKKKIEQNIAEQNKKLEERIQKRKENNLLYGLDIPPSVQNKMPLKNKKEIFPPQDEENLLDGL